MKTFFSLRKALGQIPQKICVLTIIIATTVGLAFARSNATAGSEYVAHEWGTFTSVQASDGALLNWQAVAPVELPAFVYSWARPGLNRVALPNLNKGQMALQRMETPVVYFYGSRNQKVDLTVQFPKGKITEWYPQAKVIGPSTPPSTTPGYDLAQLLSRTRESLIRWNFEILPPVQNSSITLPMEKSGNHYFAARETDAAVLRVSPTESGHPSIEYEKFLFYRGVGNFGTPLKVTMSASGEVTLANTGPEALRDLFLLGVDHGSGNFVHISGLAPGEQKTLHLDLDKHNTPLQELAPRVGADFAMALTGQGLYQRESEAMVKTWRDSWFQEQGLRVLYILPRAWTDQTLPIDLKPEPSALVRVMVGRAELITPALENKLAEQLTRAKAGDAAAWANAKILLNECGRFALPVFDRILAKLDPKREDKVLAALLSEPAHFD